MKIKFNPVGIESPTIEFDCKCAEFEPWGVLRIDDGMVIAYFDGESAWWRFINTDYASGLYEVKFEA